MDEFVISGRPPKSGYESNITNTVATTDAGYSSIGTGRATTTNAVALSSATCKRVDITALYTNSNYVFIGDSNVNAGTGTERGTPLTPGQTITLYVSNLNLIYFVPIVATEGITYTYYA